MQLNSGYGWRDLNGKPDFHDGLDLRAKTPLPFYAMTDVEIVEAEAASGFGYWIVARANVDGQVVDFVYGHMDSLNGVKAGDTFKKGVQLGLTGSNSGAGPGSIAPHLHIEVWIGGRYQGKAIDPAPWLRAFGVTI
jgi:murein DD-endopeptidase MepM/ murein hydrolase activator NlpD